MVVVLVVMCMLMMVYIVEIEVVDGIFFNIRILNVSCDSLNTLSLRLYITVPMLTCCFFLAQVINKKIWRDIIKGLNLPSTVTSAAFTLRTQ